MSKLLSETSVEVNIISGQLDLIIPTPGTYNWIRKVQWPGADDFANSKRNIIGVDRVLEGYYQVYNKFAFYCVNRAGHSVPADNPAAMDWILQRIIRNKHY